MKKMFIAFLLGTLIQGLWLQYRFTGTFLSNEVRPELCQNLTQ